jgi:hypothetical protein
LRTASSSSFRRRAISCSSRSFSVKERSNRRCKDATSRSNSSARREASAALIQPRMPRLVDFVQPPTPVFIGLPHGKQWQHKLLHGLYAPIRGYTSASKIQFYPRGYNHQSGSVLTSATDSECTDQRTPSRDLARFHDQGCALALMEVLSRRTPSAC